MKKKGYEEEEYAENLIQTENTAHWLKGSLESGLRKVALEPDS